WESGSRSRTHEMFGTIGQWMYEDLAGIQSVGPNYAQDVNGLASGDSAYKQILVQPLVVPGAGINSASAQIQTQNGPASSSWNDANGDGSMELDVTIPADSTAQVVVPLLDANQFVTESGKPAAQQPDVTLVSKTATAATYNVGSGSYTF